LIIAKGSIDQLVDDGGNIKRRPIRRFDIDHLADLIGCMTGDVGRG